MTIAGFEMVFYTLSFVVPGFILYSVIASIVPRKTEEKELSLLRYLILSCVNYAVWSWLIYLLFKLDFFTQHPIRSALAWSLIIFLSPVVLGLLFGKLSSIDWSRKLLAHFGLVPIHPIPTAWDYLFSKTEPVWLLVTMKDGSQIAGFFGGTSFASSDPSERDLYIQEVYKVIQDGPWQKIPDNKGILIKAEEIKHLEFWKERLNGGEL